MENLSTEAKELRNAYLRDWRKKNPDKVKKQADEYWERKAAKYSIEQKAKVLQAKGMTQREIAEKLNISLGSVNKYLNKNEQE